MALSQYLNQTVTHYTRSGYDSYAREVDAGVGTGYSARVQLVTKRILLPNGEIMTIDALCFIAGEPGIEIDDRIDYKGVKYRVHGKKENVDGQGNVHHVTLQLAKSTN
jgi:hypothetical protein